MQNTEQAVEKTVTTTDVIDESVQTEETQNTSEETKLKKADDVIAYLSEKFPVCFSVKGPAKPLKVGIFKELAESLDDDNKVSRTTLRSALRKYTSSWRYLESIKKGAFRINLLGEQAEEIEQEHVDHAQETLVASKKVAAEKRAKNMQNKKRNEKPNKAKKAAKLNVKSSAKKTAEPSKKPVKQDLKQDTDLFVGKSIKIALGNSPVAGTIKELNNDEVVVETVTGFTVKTEKKKIVS